jgi:NAD(P)-dependent dehydrogenase (short-subunit alcohol dehydrogenase family)
MTEAKINPGRNKAHPAPAKPVVLMTGATGFLGGAIGKALAANYTVVGLDRTPKDLAHAECVRCDFTADESVDEALREVMGVLALPAAILPLIETGPGKDSDCRALIDQVEKRTGASPP